MLKIDCVYERKNNMSETLKTLLNRRSMRAYKNEQIKDEDLQTILEVKIITWNYPRKGQIQF